MGQVKNLCLAIRPEHATLDGAQGALLPGTLSDVVYFGTDTHYHVDLDSGGRFVVRRQNQPDQAQTGAVGDKVGINFAPGIGQVLRD